VRLGVHVVRFPWGRDAGGVGAGLRRLAEAAEGAGAHGVSLMDHYFGPPGRGSVDDPMLEGYTSLGFLAAVTSQLRLRLLVTGVTYRHPGLLAKIVATLDVLSGGRAELGIGAAWYEREHEGLGVPFPMLRERFERLEETLQICLQMWGPDDGPFHGHHYRLAETRCSPAPVSRPHPRMLVGGGGERKTLWLVAKYADACNLPAASPVAVEHKLTVLRRHCQAEYRSYGAIAKTIVYRGDLLTTGRHDQFLRLMSRYAALGIEEVFVLAAGKRPEKWVERHCTPVIPRLNHLGAGHLS
jgi:F420-dependent oxidoreductase-like protein